MVGIKKAFHAWNAESSDIFMSLDTNLIINSVKDAYINYMKALGIPEEITNELAWNEDKHLAIYAIVFTLSGKDRCDALIFGVKSDNDNLKFLRLPANIEIPFQQHRDTENVFDYLVKHKLINMNTEDKGGLFTITNKYIFANYNNEEEVIEAFKQWSYHFLDFQLKLIKENIPLYSSDYQIEYSDESTNIINKVNDSIFSYQYNEATQLFQYDFYLGSACVFGVALERICVLIAKKNNVKYPKDKTELGPFAYTLYKEHVINDSFRKRILAASKFRNLSSHTNAEAVKGDALVLDAIIQELVEEYL
ncbi:hypothetical protein [Pediococcus acidilactici]|uniref:hypothetical protein n=1 Tax=Pediococcus acidilactici TaxID=1254 RepID=UPI0013290289|nr:hypothetical protein [Pediococcus acidilactici]KAF0380501.1 hypothetical protein GBO63_02275 [Pediococcus acidilactici]KAF0488149.1 hypothetical protein GBP14_00555 [Pediococcus acidilactici]KAF0567071.1 hypothetical protein GBP53_01335 [Pediococcus acidilactici]